MDVRRTELRVSYDGQELHIGNEVRNIESGDGGTIERFYLEGCEQDGYQLMLICEDGYGEKYHFACADVRLCRPICEMCHSAIADNPETIRVTFEGRDPRDVTVCYRCKVAAAAKQGGAALFIAAAMHDRN